MTTTFDNDSDNENKVTAAAVKAAKQAAKPKKIPSKATGTKAALAPTGSALAKEAEGKLAEVMANNAAHFKNTFNTDYVTKYEKVRGPFPDDLVCACCATPITEKSAEKVFQLSQDHRNIFVHGDCMHCQAVIDPNTGKRCMGSLLFKLGKTGEPRINIDRRGMPVCINHADDHALGKIPVFEESDRDGQIKFLDKYGFVKVVPDKNMASAEEWYAEHERVIHGFAVANGKAYETFKEDTDDWAASYLTDDMLQKSCMFGVFGKSNAKELMAPFVQSREAYGVRERYLGCFANFLVRPNTSDRWVVPGPCPYILIAQRASGSFPVTCFTMDTKNRTTTKRNAPQVMMSGFVFFEETSRALGGVQVAIASYTPAEDKKKDFLDLYSVAYGRAPDLGRFPENNAFVGSMVAIPMQPGEALFLRAHHPFCFFSGAKTHTGMFLAASNINGKGATWSTRVDAMLGGYVIPTDPNRTVIRYPDRLPPVPQGMPLCLPGVFTPVMSVTEFPEEAFGYGRTDPSKWPAECRPKSVPVVAQLSNQKDQMSDMPILSGDDEPEDSGNKSKTTQKQKKRASSGDDEEDASEGNKSGAGAGNGGGGEGSSSGGGEGSGDGDDDEKDDEDKKPSAPPSPKAKKQKKKKAEPEEEEEEEKPKKQKKPAPKEEEEEEEEKPKKQKKPAPKEEEEEEETPKKQKKPAPKEEEEEEEPKAAKPKKKRSKKSKAIIPDEGDVPILTVEALADNGSTEMRSDNTLDPTFMTQDNKDYLKYSLSTRFSGVKASKYAGSIVIGEGEDDGVVTVNFPVPESHDLVTRMSDAAVRTCQGDAGLVEALAGEVVLKLQQDRPTTGKTSGTCHVFCYGGKPNPKVRNVGYADWDGPVKAFGEMIGPNINRAVLMAGNCNKDYKEEMDPRQFFMIEGTPAFVLGVGNSRREIGLKRDKKPAGRIANTPGLLVEFVGPEITSLSVCAVPGKPEKTDEEPWGVFCFFTADEAIAVFNAPAPGKSKGKSKPTAAATATTAKSATSSVPAKPALSMAERGKSLKELSKAWAELQFAYEEVVKQPQFTDLLKAYTAAYGKSGKTPGDVDLLWVAQDAFQALYTAVTEKPWSNGRKAPSATAVATASAPSKAVKKVKVEEEEEEEEEEEKPAQKKKKAASPAPAAAKAKKAKKEEVGDLFEYASLGESNLGAKNLLVGLPAKTYKEELHSDGKTVVRRSNREKTSPVGLSKQDAIRQGQEEMERDEWKAEENRRRKLAAKNNAKFVPVTFEAYQMRKAKASRAADKRDARMVANDQDDEDEEVVPGKNKRGRDNGDVYDESLGGSGGGSGSDESGSESDSDEYDDSDSDSEGGDDIESQVKRAELLYDEIYAANATAIESRTVEKKARDLLKQVEQAKAKYEESEKEKDAVTFISLVEALGEALGFKKKKLSDEELYGKAKRGIGTIDEIAAPVQVIKRGFNAEVSDTLTADFVHKLLRTAVYFADSIDASDMPGEKVATLDAFKALMVGMMDSNQLATARFSEKALNRFIELYNEFYEVAKKAAPAPVASAPAPNSGSSSSNKKKVEEPKKSEPVKKAEEEVKKEPVSRKREAEPEPEIEEKAAVEEPAKKKAATPKKEVVAVAVDGSVDGDKKKKRVSPSPAPTPVKKARPQKEEEEEEDLKPIPMDLADSDEESEPTVPSDDDEEMAENPAAAPILQNESPVKTAAHHASAPGESDAVYAVCFGPAVIGAAMGKERAMKKAMEKMMVADAVQAESMVDARVAPSNWRDLLRARGLEPLPGNLVRLTVAQLFPAPK